MKRNITVNLYGSLYNIDEDAYELLNQYLSNIRAFFSKQPDGSEVADDIEARVAELMDEKREADGNVISIEDVQSIIQRIGTPDDMCRQDDEFSSADGESHHACPPPPYSPGCMKSPGGKKKLYRDVDHKMLGGVLAGLGQYLGVDPLWLRLLAVVLAFASWGAVVAVYVVLWILIPAAVTPAERLEMKGEPVNMESLGDEIINDKSVPQSHNSYSFLNSLLQLFCALFKGMLFVCGAGAILFFAGLFLWMTVMMAWAAISPGSFVYQVLDIENGVIDLHTALPPLPMWGLYICGSIFLLVSIYFLVYALIRMAGRKPGMPVWTRGVGLTVWIVSLFLSAGCLGMLIGNVIREDSAFNIALRNMRDQQKEQRKEQSVEYLKRNGWKIVRDSNVSSFSSYGEDFTGIHGRHYLEGSNSSGEMEYEVVRQVKVAPGLYTLSAYGRTNGNGAEIFATNGRGKRFSAPIPSYGSHGGEVWEEASRFVEADTAHTSALYQRMKRIADTDGGEGRGWSRVTVSNVTVGPDSVLTYGVTNCSPSVVWDGTWLSASSFELKKAEGVR